MSAKDSQYTVSGSRDHSSPGSNGRIRSSSSSPSNPPASIKEAWELVLNQILTRTGADGAAIALREQDGFDCKAMAGDAASVLALANEDEGLVLECVRTGKVILSDDARRDPRIGPAVCQLLNLGSLVIAPLLIDEQVDGLLLISSPRAFAFGEAAMNTISAVAAAIELILSDLPRGKGAAIENSVLEVPATSEPSSSPFASAFARAMAESAADGKQPNSVDKVSAADLFSAAGMFRADGPASQQEPEPDVDYLPDLKFVPPEDDITDAAATEFSGPAPSALQKPSIPADVNQTVSSLVLQQTAPKSASTTVPPAAAPAKPAAVAKLQPEVREPAARKGSVRAWMVALAVLFVALGAATFWFGRQYKLFRHNAATVPQLPAQTAPVIPSVAANTAAAETPSPATSTPKSLKPEPTPAATHAQAAVRPPAKPNAQERASEAVRKVVATPTVTNQPRAEENPAPPPITANDAIHPSSELHALDLPGVSTVPVLSSGVYISSVMLPVEREPGSTFIAARAVAQKLPSYPEAARSENRQGAVVLIVTVSPSGRVSQVRVIQGDPILTGAAASAAQSWRYEPAKVDDRPVESTIRVTMTFHLAR